MSSLTSLDDDPLSVATDPGDRVALDDSIRMALLVVLERLNPPERAAFVLHDVFQFSFDVVAQIVGRTPVACRQIACRARRHIEAETGPRWLAATVDEQHRVIAEFIAACAGGDIDALMRVLDPNIDVDGDVDLGPDRPARRPFHGNDAVGNTLLGFYGPASGTTAVSQPINRQPGALAFKDHQLFSLLIFDIDEGRIHEVHANTDPRKLALATAGLGDGRKR